MVEEMNGIENAAAGSADAPTKTDYYTSGSKEAKQPSKVELKRLEPVRKDTSQIL